MSIMGLKELDIDRYLFFFYFWVLWFICNHQLCTYLFFVFTISFLFLDLLSDQLFSMIENSFFLNKMTSSSRYLKIYIEIKKNFFQLYWLLIHSRVNLVYFLASNKINEQTDRMRKTNDILFFSYICIHINMLDNKFI